MPSLLAVFLIAASLQAATPAGMMPIPLLFEENRGQSPEAAYLTRAGNAEVRFSQAITYLGAKGSYTVHFIGASKHPRLTGEQRHPARVNYYRGTSRLENIPAYQSLRYRALYHGIDLVYHGRSGELEYDFQIAPGADPRAIALHFEGARHLEIASGGDLLVYSAGEITRHKRPIAYQNIRGQRHLIPAYFRKQGNTIRFAVAPYNRRYPLTIDPVLKFSSALGTAVTSLAADANGNTLIAAPLNIANSDIDVQYLKLDSTGQLIYKTVLGGFGADTVAGIAVDSQGNLFATGHSVSSNYPVNGAQCSGLTTDAFLSKLSPTGSLLASRCYGGALTESVRGIGLDNAGTPHIAGTTDSADLPTTSPVLQNQKRRPNATNAFVAKFDPTTLALIYGTYFGNYAEITLDAMAVDPGGAVLLSGRSTPQGFPLTPGAYLTTTASTNPIFLAKINASGNALVYSTWLPLDSLFSSSTTVRIGADESGQAYALLPAGGNLGFSGVSFTRLLRFSAEGVVNLDKSLPFVNQPTALDVDRQGNLLLAGTDTFVAALTSDALFPRGGQSFAMKLDNAGNILHATSLPGPIAALRLAANEMIFALQPQCCDTTYPITPGAYAETPSSFAPTSGVYRMAQAATCSPTLEAGTNFNLPTQGGQSSLRIVAPDNCTWALSVSPSFQWFQLGQQRSGTGSATIPFSYVPLSSGETGRSATLRISAATSYEFTQGSPSTCQFPQGSSNVYNADPGGTLISISVPLAEGCSWTATPNASWLRILSANTGKGSGQVVLEALPNGGAARTATVSINSQNNIVNQQPCTFFLSTANAASVQAESLSFNLQTQFGCNWSISSNAPWLQLAIDPTTVRTGPGSVSATVQHNTTGNSRTATLTVAGTQFNFFQTGLDCSIGATLSPSSFGSAGGSGSIQVTTQPSCLITSFNQSSVALTPPAINGSGTMNFNIGSNSTALPKAFLTRLENGTISVFRPIIQDGANVPQPFTDVPAGSTFFNHIAILKDRNVTRGCTFDGQRYCPSDAVTRADMAAFLMRAMNLPIIGIPQSSAIPFFDDVPPSHPAFIPIQAIRAANITLGCTSIPANYCPDAQLTRGQMAALIVRAKLGGENFAYNSTPYFTDVPATHPFFRHIQKLRDLGVTLGCTTTTFCPDAPNTRGEMSAFIVRAFLSGQ